MKLRLSLLSKPIQELLKVTGISFEVKRDLEIDAVSSTGTKTVPLFGNVSRRLARKNACPARLRADLDTCFLIRLSNFASRSDPHVIRHDPTNAREQ
jgi:hypothetical protein